MRLKVHPYFSVNSTPTYQSVGVENAYLRDTKSNSMPVPGSAVPLRANKFDQDKTMPVLMDHIHGQGVVICLDVEYLESVWKGAIQAYFRSRTHFCPSRQIFCTNHPRQYSVRRHLKSTIPNHRFASLLCIPYHGRHVFIPPQSQRHPSALMVCIHEGMLQ